MTKKILVCKICGEEIISTSLWQVNIEVHLFKHKEIESFGVPGAVLRKKYFTEKLGKINASN